MLPRNATVSQDTEFVSSLPEILGRLSSSYLHPLPGVDEVTVESWQLVTAIHCEGDGLILYE